MSNIQKNIKTEEIGVCPVCQNAKPVKGELCSDCELFRLRAEEQKKLMNRICAFNPFNKIG